MHARHLAALLAGATVTLASCGVGAAARDTGENGLVGIAMPTQSKERWVDDGRSMVTQFREEGYGTDLQYAEDVVEDQIAQIENMIAKDVDVLVVAPIDGNALGDVVQRAADSGIPVISYDRLIRGSDNVDYYATFDNHRVGVLQGRYIEQALGLDKGKGPFTIELFSGSPDDNNSGYFFDGAMSVLRPYIEDGDLRVASGQTGMEQTATLRWDGENAQSRMDDLLSAHYSNRRLDAVLAPADSVSVGILSSLKGVGYGAGDTPMPVVTGQDAEVPAVKSIARGEQSQTVFKDTRKLADVAVDMADAVATGTRPEVNDTTTYDNGEKVVPSHLLDPVSVDRDNYEEELVDSGYYTKDELS